MLKQRDYYIYAYLPQIQEVFRSLPLSVTGVIFLYFLIFSSAWLWVYRTNLEASETGTGKKDEKYKAELLKSSEKGRSSQHSQS